MFDYDAEAYFSLGAQIASAVEAMAGRVEAQVLTLEERLDAFEQDLGIEVNPTAFSLIEGLETPADLAAACGEDRRRVHLRRRGHTRRLDRRAAFPARAG